MDFVFKLKTPDINVYSVLCNRLEKNGFKFASDNARNIIMKALMSGDYLLACNDGSLKYTNGYKDISNKTILIFEEMLELKHEHVEVRLNEMYVAKVNKDCISVGSIKVSFEKFNELAEAVKKVTGE